MSKRIDIVVGVMMIFSVVGGVGYTINEMYNEKKLYIDFLNNLNLKKNDMKVYINNKKMLNGKKLVEGLKKIKIFRVNVRGSTFGKCQNIKIIYQDSGMKICAIGNSMNNLYYYIIFQEYYVGDSGWQPLYIEPGTLTKKYIEKYIEPYLEEDKELK